MLLANQKHGASAGAAAPATAGGSPETAITECTYRVCDELTRVTTAEKATQQSLWTHADGNGEMSQLTTRSTPAVVSEPAVVFRGHVRYEACEADAAGAETTGSGVIARARFLTHTACDHIVALCEEHAAAHAGWSGGTTIATGPLSVRC
jgi:hypothetical protein